MELVDGETVGGFVVFRDDGGLRHAVRPGCILAVSDADETQGETIVQFPEVALSSFNGVWTRFCPGLA